jgi:alanyl-tRNA synthetase
MDMLELKKAYLKFMNERKPNHWEVRQSPKLIDSTFPHCYTISGAVDFFNRKVNNSPLQSEAFTYWVRCFRHYDLPDDTHLPFFWMLLDVSWNLDNKYSRTGAIKDNFAFLEKIGLDRSKLKVTCWQGGKIYGKGINLEADVEHTCVGPEFRKLQKEGMYIARDDEAIEAWKSCGIKDSQIVLCGEIGTLDPSGFDAIMLNAREHFCGVRSEPYYDMNGRFVEIGVYLSEEYTKKTTSANVDPNAFAADSDESNFLLHLKANPIPAGFGCERMLMAINGLDSVMDIEPYKTIRDTIIKKGKLSASNKTLAETTCAYIPAIAFLVYDGANLLIKNSMKARRGIYRQTLKTVIQNMRKFGLDKDENYAELFGQAVGFFTGADEYKALAGIDKQCLEEIQKQQARMKIEDKQKAGAAR